MDKRNGILGINIANLTAKELKARIIDFATSHKQRIILYANVNSINLAQKDNEFRNILNSADLLHCDGWGVVWGSRVLKVPLKEKIVVTDFFVKFCEELAERKVSLYFLGGKVGAVEKAKEKLQQEIPLLHVAGLSHGYFDEKDEARIVNDINNSRADILVVGMGTPKQEGWIYRNQHRLNVSLCWAVGGLFDFISGGIKRAPSWMLHCHLEWLYRLFREPKRLWRRYLEGNMIFVYRILKISCRFR